MSNLQEIAAHVFLRKKKQDFILILLSSSCRILKTYKVNLLRYRVGCARERLRYIYAIRRET
jgi:hypothetical protein